MLIKCIKKLSDLEKEFNLPRILNLLFSDVPQAMSACYVIHCHTVSQNANSSMNISAKEVLQLKYCMRNNILLASHKKNMKLNYIGCKNCGGIKAIFKFH